LECLESLGHLRYRDFWVVLVDNGSTDDSVDQIRAWARGEVPVESPFFKEPGWAKPVRLVEYEGEPSLEQVALEPAAEAPYVTLVRLPENRGFAAGNNVAIRYALARGAEWTWLRRKTQSWPPGVPPRYCLARGRLRLVVGSCRVWHCYREPFEAGFWYTSPWLEYAQTGREAYAEVSNVGVSA